MTNLPEFDIDAVSRGDLKVFKAKFKRDFFDATSDENNKPEDNFDYVAFLYQKQAQREGITLTEEQLDDIITFGFLKKIFATQEEDKSDPLVKQDSKDSDNTNETETSS